MVMRNERHEGKGLRRHLGVLIGCLWGGYTAAYCLKGNTYLYLGALCVAVFAAGIRVGRRRSIFAPSGHRYGIGLGLALWWLGATCSLAINWRTELVVVTYLSVFVGGAVIYIGLDGIEITGHELEVGIAGLVAGSLVPLLLGLRAFWGTWGSTDWQVILNAYQDPLRMLPYEEATYGNRGNTANFIVIVAPICFWVVLDSSRRLWIRAVCAVALIPVSVSLVVLGVRAAFITMLLAFALIWGFKLGVRRYIYFVASCALGGWLFARYAADITETLSDRLEPVVTVDAVQDPSVLDRSAAIKEGIEIGVRHWLVGIGPGAGLSEHSLTSAHQLFVQQFMETGILGLAGSIALTLGVFALLLRTLLHGQDKGANNLRFTLIIGPASFLVYGVLANDTFNLGIIDTWTALVASLLALTPRFPRPRRWRTKTAGSLQIPLAD